MGKQRKTAREKEPFKPQDTPKPPQVIEPNKRKQRPDEGDKSPNKSKRSGGRAHSAE